MRSLQSIRQQKQAWKTNIFFVIIKAFGMEIRWGLLLKLGWLTFEVSGALLNTWGGPRNGQLGDMGGGGWPPHGSIECGGRCSERVHHSWEVHHTERQIKKLVRLLPQQQKRKYQNHQICKVYCLIITTSLIILYINQKYSVSKNSYGTKAIK